MPGPLAGLRVLELARILAGPWAGQILADLGADVIKVERKGAGDDTRTWGPPFVEAADGGHLGAAYFHGTNRGKRSIEVDFESEEGRRIVKKLAARSDVLIENFKVGGLAKFGLDYESLAPENPRLIYCSVTGFGQTGPYASRPGYDLMAQGMGGFMDLTGTADGEPTARRRAGVRHFHRRLFGGRHPRGAGAAGKNRPRRLCRHRAGRFHRRRAGQPGAQLSRLRQRAAAHRQRASRTSCPTRCFRSPTATSSSPPATTASSSKLCGVLGAPDLAKDPAYIDNKARLAHRAELIERICALTARIPRAELLQKLEAVGVPAGPINDLAQVFSDPQVIHRGMQLELPSAAAKGGKIPGVRTPIVIDGAPMAAERPSPRLGEHTAEILREIGEG